MNTAILHAMICVVKLLYPAYSAIPNKIIIAQALLETNKFKSPIFRENNNLFGMKKAYTRKHYQNGENRNHATYASWFHSVLDYFARVADFKNSYKLYGSDYYKFLEKTGYAEPQKAGTPTYIQRVRSVADSLPDFDIVKPLLLVGAFFFTGL